MGTLTNYVESNFLLYVIADQNDEARAAVADLDASAIGQLHHQLRRAMLLADSILTERIDAANEAAYQKEIEEG